MSCNGCNRDGPCFHEHTAYKYTICVQKKMNVQNVTAELEEEITSLSREWIVVLVLLALCLLGCVQEKIIKNIVTGATCVFNILTCKPCRNCINCMCQSA